MIVSAVSITSIGEVKVFVCSTACATAVFVALETSCMVTSCIPELNSAGRPVAICMTAE